MYFRILRNRTVSERPRVLKLVVSLGGIALIVIPHECGIPHVIPHAYIYTRTHISSYFLGNDFEIRDILVRFAQSKLNIT